MKSKFEKQANEFINGLSKDLGELPSALKNLSEKANDSQGVSYLNKLPKLIFFLTNVTKKKTIKGKYTLPEKTRNWGKDEVEIGINCNGLGFVDWGSQLTPVASSHETNNGYDIDSENLKVLLWIFNDEELCLDIADHILKKSRKDFLKLASFFRKQEITPEDLNREIKTENITITFSKNWGLSDVKKNDSDIKLGWETKKFIEGNCENPKELLEETDLKELLFMEEIVTDKDKIITNTKEKITHIFEREAKQKELNNFVGEMILTYEALENL